MTNGHPPASGPRILDAIKQLASRLDDKFVREQRRDEEVDQLIRSVNQLTETVKQLQQVVRFEQDTTRRALVIHFSAEGLDKPTVLLPELRIRERGK